jgi:thioredoxin reductase (NADPH)
VTRVDFSRVPFRVWTDEEEHEARSVIVAAGASARRLNIPGEERLLGRGVSTCATCDGAFFPGKHIVVAGGGDSAAEEAVFLTRFASKVTLIHRRDTLRASKIMADRALRHPKITFLPNKVAQEAHGAERLELLTLRDVVTNERSDIDADAFFIAIGHDPNTGIFKGQLDLDAQGYITSSDGVRTNIEGVFVAGDVYDVRYKQAITAAGMGCRAAMEAEKYLESLETHHEPKKIGA